MLFANLPAPSLSLLGTFEYTTDQNICYCNGTQWIPRDQMDTVPYIPVYLFSQLPSVLAQPVGTILYTSDMGPVVNDGVTWDVISTATGGGAPTFGAPLSATAATSQDNWNPAGLTSSINRLIITTAVGDSTVTGIANPGWPDGWILFIDVTAASSGQLIMPGMSGSSSAGNQFTAGVAIAPGFGGLFVFTAGVGYVPL